MSGWREDTRILIQYGYGRKAGDSSPNLLAGRWAHTVVGIRQGLGHDKGGCTQAEPSDSPASRLDRSHCPKTELWKRQRRALDGHDLGERRPCYIVATMRTQFRDHLPLKRTLLAMVSARTILYFPGNDLLVGPQRRGGCLILHIRSPTSIHGRLAMGDRRGGPG
ncbi:hypothetical protein VUR80DRAFT_8411 [Thermomyces stellatus]